MTARSPNAFFLSLLIHGAVIAAILVSAYAFKNSVQEIPHEFQLVAGPGNDYAATEAPALGTPGGPKIDFPKMPDVSMPTPPAPTPAPEPVTAPPPTTPAPSPITAAPPKDDPDIAKLPNISKTVKQTEARREKQIMRQWNKEQAAIAAAQKKAEDAEKKKMTYEEFLKSQKNSSSPKASQPNSSTKIARIDPSGLVGGLKEGKGEHQGAGGKALTAEEDDMLGRYFAALKLRLQEAHEKPLGVSDMLHATAQFNIAADGSISQVKITESSGNADFDKSVLAAFKNIPAMGPRPDHKADTRSVEFRMKDDA